MKKNIIIGIAGLFILLLFGCEDVIVVDLNSADPTIVIEATIRDDNSPSRVIITKSTDFYTPGIFPTVTGATIEVNDSEGNSFLFTEISSGVYENLAISGKSGVEYLIEVLANGKTYDAISKMPNKIIIDSLSIKKAPPRPRSKDGVVRYDLHIYFQDQPGVADYCRFKLYNNGVQLNGFTIYNDKLTDGNYIDFRMTLNREKNEIAVGDILTVELLSIDESAFEFYKTANSVSASGSNGRGPNSTSAAPSNPVTNWSNNALGYFSAYAVSRDSIIIVE